MDMDAISDADNKEQLQMVENDNSCRQEVILTRDNEGSCTTECLSGDWSAEVIQEKLADLKQHSHDVCCVHCFTYSVCQNKMNRMDEICYGWTCHNLKLICFVLCSHFSMHQEYLTIVS